MATFSPGQSSLLLYLLIDVGHLIPGISSVTVSELCSKVFCMNGRCVTNSEGQPVCLCTSGWRGLSCDQRDSFSPRKNLTWPMVVQETSIKCPFEHNNGHLCGSEKNDEQLVNKGSSMDYTGILVMIGILIFLAFCVFVYAYLPTFSIDRYPRTDRFVNYLHNFSLDSHLRGQYLHARTSPPSPMPPEQVPLNDANCTIHCFLSSRDRVQFHNGSASRNCTCRAQLSGPLFCHCLEASQHPCHHGIPTRISCIGHNCIHLAHPPLQARDSNRSGTTVSDSEPPPSYFDVMFGGAGRKVETNGRETPPPAYEDL